MFESRIVFLFLSLAVFNTAIAGEVTSGFSEGDTLTASSLNDIKNNVNDNHDRLSSVETAVQNIPSIEADYSGYKTPFAEIGSAKNVVVLVNNSDSELTRYIAHSFYKNASEKFSVNGTFVTPALVSQSVEVAVEKTGGSLIYVGTNSDMPTSEAYVDYTTESATFDTSSLAKTVDYDKGGAQISCKGTGATTYCNIENQDNGVATSTSKYLSVHRLLGPGSINGIDFSDLKSSEKFFTSSSSRYSELYAKGIGKVFKASSDGRVYEVIYYQVDGVQGGSLAGTPFESGATLSDLFF